LKPVRLRSTLFIGILAAAATPVSAQTAALPDVLSRTTDYVQQFIRQFSSVVAEEHYVQESQLLPKTTGSGFQQAFVLPTERLELQSDFLLVRTSESSDYVAFRDVYSVDGRAVRDRRERLTRLFLQTPAVALDQARQVERESARYNLRPARSISNPLIAIGILQPRYRDRFDYTLGDADRRIGPDVVVVRYREKARPTIFKAADGHDLPAEGRLWIDAPTGRVVKSEVVTSGSDTSTTTFASDSEFKIDVPVEMREAYPLGRASMTGVAKYGRFRRFSVQTEQELRPK
jgi:hypothetical protein